MAIGLKGKVDDVAADLCMFYTHKDLEADFWTDIERAVIPERIEHLKAQIQKLPTKRRQALAKAMLRTVGNKEIWTEDYVSEDSYLVWTTKEVLERLKDYGF